MLWCLSAFCVSGTSVHLLRTHPCCGHAGTPRRAPAPPSRGERRALRPTRQRSHLNRRNVGDTTHLVNPHAASSSHGNRAQRYDDQANANLSRTHNFFLGNAFRFQTSWSVGRRVPSEYGLHPIRVSGRTNTVQLAQTRRQRGLNDSNRGIYPEHLHKLGHFAKMTQRVAGGLVVAAKEIHVEDVFPRAPAHGPGFDLAQANVSQREDAQ